MKVILSILLTLPAFIFSQEYFLLNSLESDFEVKEYTLDTKEIYNIRKDINLYNVYVSKENILLLSVLPDLDEKILPRMDERGSNWKIIDYDKIKDKIFSKSEILNMVFNWKSDNTPDKKTLQYKIVKKENGSYYVSKLCLTEFFSIADFKFPIISTYGTINIGEPKVSIKQMQESFKKQIPVEEFIMDVRTGNYFRRLDNSYSFRNYLSKEFFIKRNKAYQFWTFDGWWVIDGYNEHRGIDRFLYIPDKGIVGGSYDFYFRLKPKISSNDYFTVSDYALWDNIMNEKIMIAKELK